MVRALNLDQLDPAATEILRHEPLDMASECRFIGELVEDIADKLKGGGLARPTVTDQAIESVRQVNLGAVDEAAAESNRPDAVEVGRNLDVLVWCYSGGLSHGRSLPLVRERPALRQPLGVRARGMRYDDKLPGRMKTQSGSGWLGSLSCAIEHVRILGGGVKPYCPKCKAAGLEVAGGQRDSACGLGSAHLSEPVRTAVWRAP